MRRQHTNSTAGAPNGKSGFNADVSFICIAQKSLAEKNGAPKSAPL